VPFYSSPSRPTAQRRPQDRDRPGRHKVHTSVTGAPARYVNVSFVEVPPGNLFVATSDGQGPGWRDPSGASPTRTDGRPGLLPGGARGAASVPGDEAAPGCRQRPGACHGTANPPRRRPRPRWSHLVGHRLVADEQVPRGTSTNDTFTYRAGAPVTEVCTLVTARAISGLGGCAAAVGRDGTGRRHGTSSAGSGSVKATVPPVLRPVRFGQIARCNPLHRNRAVRHEWSTNDRGPRRRRGGRPAPAPPRTERKGRSDGFDAHFCRCPGRWRPWPCILTSAGRAGRPHGRRHRARLVSSVRRVSPSMPATR